MLEQIENGMLIQETKMNILQAIQFITKSWDEITADSIRNCWHHTKILPNANRMEIDITNDTTIDDLSELINKLHLSDPMQVDDFLLIPEENIIYDIPDDQLIREIAEMFKEDTDEGNAEEMDDSTEITTISASVALKSLENVRLFLLQQEDTGEQLRLLNNLERFVSGKKSSQMKQTTLNQYFN